MRTVIGPREEGSVATVATSSEEDTTPATIKTTLYDLIAALQEVVEPGEDGLVVATVVSMLRAGRIRSVVGGLGQESASEPEACRRQSARSAILA
jgi:hypothetical protein